MTETYLVGYKCSNCFSEYLVYYYKGVEAALCLDCPNCENKNTLNKIPAKAAISGKRMSYHEGKLK